MPKWKLMIVMSPYITFLSNQVSQFGYSIHTPITMVMRHLGHTLITGLYWGSCQNTWLLTVILFKSDGITADQHCRVLGYHSSWVSDIDETSRSWDTEVINQAFVPFDARPILSSVGGWWGWHISVVARETWLLYCQISVPWVGSLEDRSRNPLKEPGAAPQYFTPKVLTFWWCAVLVILSAEDVKMSSWPMGSGAHGQPTRTGSVWFVIFIRG